MTLPIDIKFKVLPRFPAQVIGREGIAVTRQNGIYYFDLDYANFPTSSTLPDGSYTLIFNPGSNSYTLVPPTTFSGSTNGITNVKDFGAIGDGVTDDTVAIQSAINHVNSMGGGIVNLGIGRYLINSATLTIPQGVFLEGFWKNLGERTSDDYSQLPCVLLLNPTYTIQITGRDAGIKGVAVINSTLTTPTTLRQLLDGINSFSGTGITVGTGVTNSASDFYLGYLFVMGFAQGIHAWGNQERPRVEHIAMDNTAGYLSDGCSDVGSFNALRCWAYYGAHLSVGYTFAISNAINNGAGLIRITCAANPFVTGDTVLISGVTGTTEANGRWIATVINSTTIDLQGSTFANAYVSGGNVYARYFQRSGAAYDFKGQGGGFNTFVNLGAYGYDIGIKIEAGDDYDNLVGCWIDNFLPPADPTPVGVWILNSAAVSLDGCTLTSQGTSLLVDVAGRSNNRVYISNSRLYGQIAYSARIINGSANFSNCFFGTAPILIDGTTLQSFFVGCDLINTSFSYSSQSSPRAYIAACRGPTSSQSFFQPTGLLDTPNTVIASWNGPARAAPANQDQIIQQYYMMNSAGNMVQIQSDHHRIATTTAGAETSQCYMSLINAGIFGDYFSWQPAQYMPIVAGVNLGANSTANRWSTVFCGGLNANSPTIGIGYATGAGGTVTQITSRTTGVVLNTVSGDITMFSAAGSATPATFTVTNSAVVATDTIILNVRSGATNVYNFAVTTVAAGSFVVTFWTTGGTATDAPVLQFAVIKGATS
jgi:hypothetical protein